MFLDYKVTSQARRPIAQTPRNFNTAANSPGSSAVHTTGDGVTISKAASAAGAADRTRAALETVGVSVGAEAGVGQGLLEVTDLLGGLNPITAPLVHLKRALMLRGVEDGVIEPDRDSRLGAFEATGGNQRGTTGRAAHNAIGGIYMVLGTFGQDKIGTVFNSSEARGLYDRPLSDGSSRRLAEAEYQYWRHQRDTHGTAGGYMGSAFSPVVRDAIQQFLGRF